MPHFGNHSLTMLDSCDERLQAVFFEAIEHFDCKIIEGHRGEERQNEMLTQGKSMLGWPNSRHNAEPSLAIDAAPWPIVWEDRERFYAFGGFVKGIAVCMSIPIRWGGDWDGDWSFKDQDFHDLGHFEIREG